MRLKKGHRLGWIWSTDEDALKRDEARARALGGEFQAAIRRWRVQRASFLRNHRVTRQAA